MGNLGGSASTEIDAPLEQVWAAVEDVLTAPEWQGGLDQSSALERDADGRPTLVETVSDIKVRQVKALRAASSSSCGTGSRCETIARSSASVAASLSVIRFPSDRWR